MNYLRNLCIILPQLSYETRIKLRNSFRNQTSHRKQQIQSMVHLDYPPQNKHKTFTRQRIYYLNHRFQLLNIIIKTISRTILSNYQFLPSFRKHTLYISSTDLSLPTHPLIRQNTMILHNHYYKYINTSNFSEHTSNQNILVYIKRKLQIVIEINGMNNNNMTITVKVQFKDKLYKLAPHINSLPQIDIDMKQRFPTIPTFQYFYNDQEIKDLTPIIHTLQQQGKNSIKILAKNTTDNNQQLSVSLEAIDTSLHNQSIISLLQQTTEKTQTKSKQLLPNQFYTCYNCSGHGSLKQTTYVSLCPICGGLGTLTHEHKYIQRLLYLYQQHFLPTHKADTILSELKTESKDSIIGFDKTLEVIVTQTSKKEQVQLNQFFMMRFEIKNIGQNWRHQNIQIRQMNSKEGKSLSLLKSGDKMTIDLGPFICKKEGIMQKTFILCYKEGDNWVRFGHKFGFSVRGVRTMEKKKVCASLRERIQDLKMISGSNKSQEFLRLKLKSMGIDVMNLEIDDETIIDLIKQFV